MVDDDPTPFDRLRADVDRPLLRLFREYGPREWRWFAVGLLAGFLATGAGLLPPLLLGISIDAVFVSGQSYQLPLVPQSWIPPDAESQFLLSVVLMGGAFVFSAVMARIRGMSLTLFGQRIMHRLRTDTHSRVQELDMQFFDTKQTGEIMSVVNNDVNSLRSFLERGLTTLIQVAILLVGTAAVLFYINWQLATVTLLALPLGGGLTYWYMRRIGPYFDELRSAIGRFNTRLENSLSGIEVIKSHGSEVHEERKTSDTSWRLFDVNWNLFHLRTTYQPALTLVSGGTFVTAFVVGGLWVARGPPLGFSGTLTFGSFVVFVFLTQRFVGPLRRVGAVVNQIKSAAASGKRVFGLMDIPVEIRDDPEAVALGTVEGRIEYDDVSYGYTPDEHVLEDVSIEIEPGSTVGVVGPTGAGKTTLVKLAIRLYDPDEGRVRIDGHDLRDVRLSSLRRNIGYVSQDPFLFDGTILENIRYGRFDASREDVLEAARAAEVHHFVERFPDGYETRVGERGVKLSGGQRQRICVARAILQDPRVLILDEATSEVDTETEMLIKRSLKQLSKDRTVISIAHRLSTIRDADKIVVLEDGRVSEVGTHDDLLGADGLYANLWRVQAGELDELPEEFVQEAVERAARTEAPLEETTAAEVP